MDLMDLSGVVVRAYEPEDRGHVIDSWLRSYHRGSVPSLEWIEYPEYAQRVGDRICSWIDRGKVEIVVCVAQEDRTHILGWIAVERRGARRWLRYLYVRELYRRRGLGRMLLESVRQMEADKRWIICVQTRQWRRFAARMAEDDGWTFVMR